MPTRRRAQPGTPPPDLPALLTSWLVHLRAERKSTQTVKVYGDGVRGFLAWCAAEGLPAVLDRSTVNLFVVALLDRGAEAATARSRQLSLKRFSRWLAVEEEIERDELVGLKPPKLDSKITPRLTDAQCGALVKACAGKDLRDRRDEAIVRFMLESAIRAGELVDMTTDDVNLTEGVAVVRKGKGNKGRVVPFSPETARAMDRYLRMRRGHPLADSPTLWLGERGKKLSYDGLYRTLRVRAGVAGIDGFHPHLTRHTAAQRWLSAAGSEGGLMAVAGWTRPDMLIRYTRATASERAVQEARRLGLGDQL